MYALFSANWQSIGPFRPRFDGISSFCDEILGRIRVLFMVAINDAVLDGYFPVVLPVVPSAKTPASISGANLCQTVGAGDAVMPPMISTSVEMLYQTRIMRLFSRLVQ